MGRETIGSTVILIMGMSSASERERLSQLLAGISGVTDVDVSLHRAQATVLHAATCHPAVLVWTVVKAGFGAALATPESSAGEEERGGEGFTKGADR